MHRLLLLRLAAVLVLLTGFAHLAGTLMEIPADQSAVRSTAAVMRATPVPMPVGPARNYFDILQGNNFATCILLFLVGTQVWTLARHAAEPAAQRALWLAAGALAAFAAVSALYFFPIPAVFTAAAALLIVVARFRPES